MPGPSPFLLSLLSLVLLFFVPMFFVLSIPDPWPLSSPLPGISRRGMVYYSPGLRAFLFHVKQLREQGSACLQAYCDIRMSQQVFHVKHRCRICQAS
jgi:hypothetical protein